MNTTTSKNERATTDKKDGGGAGPRTRRSRRGAEAPDRAPGKFYIGTTDQGVPVLEREVSEQEALIDCVKTGRPFMQVQFWSTAQEMTGGGLVVVKAPVKSANSTMAGN